MRVPCGLDIRRPCACVPRIRPSWRIIRPLWETICHVVSLFSTSIHHLVFDNLLTQHRHLWQVCFERVRQP